MRKNIVWYVTKQYMKKNKKRTFTALLGIVFMVMLMTCVFVGKDTAIGYLQQVATQKEGKWHISLYNISEKELKEVQQLEWVKKMAKSVEYGFTEFEQSGNSARPYLNVKAYEEVCFDWMNIKLVSGRFPAKAGEIILSKDALEDGASIAVGDTIDAEYFNRLLTGLKETNYFPFYGITLKEGETIELPQNFFYTEGDDGYLEKQQKSGKQQKLTIVGIMERPSYEDVDAAGYTAITLWDKNESIGEEKFNLSVMLDLHNLPSDYYEKVMKIAGEENIEVNDYVLVFSGDSSEKTMNMVVTYLTIFFVVLIMFSSMVLIYNVFNMSFKERSRYLGMLSSVGATGKQKRSSVYYEAVYLLLIALPIGFLAGLLIVELGMKAISPYFIKIMQFEQYITDTSVPLYISWKAMLLTGILSVITVLFSAYLPAKKIGKIGAVECIRGNIENRKRTYKMPKGVVKHFGAEGLLAGNVLKRQSRKTASQIAAVVVFLVIMVVTAFGSSAIKRMVELKMSSVSVAINAEKWDYVLSYFGDREMYEELKNEILADNSVKTMEWYCEMFIGDVPEDTYSVEYWNAVREICKLNYGDEYNEEIEQLYNFGNKGLLEKVSLFAVDDNTLKDIAKRTGTDYEKMKSTDVPSAIVVQSGKVSTDNYGFDMRKPIKYQLFDIQQMTDKQIGEKMDITLCSYERGTVVDFPIEVAGYATEEQLTDYVSIYDEQLWIIVNMEVAKQIDEIIGEESDEVMSGFTPLLYIQTENSAVINKLLKLNEQGNTKGFLHSTDDDQKKLREAIIGIVHILLICFVLLTSLICLLNVYNSIRNQITGRKQEFAIMISVGMTQKQMKKMLFYESVGMGIKSIFVAGVIAFPLMYLVQYGLDNIFGQITLMLPWGWIFAAIVIALVVIVVLTIYCYKKDKQENILESIQNESI